MVNSILTAISQTLDSVFNCPIHADAIEQCLKTPCFLITPLIQSDKHIINERYQKDIHFVIQYFPKGKHYHLECNEVAEKLTDALCELQTADGIIRAVGEMEAEIVDGVLNFTVHYKPFVIRVRKDNEDSELMGTLEATTTVKE